MIILKVINSHCPGCSILCGVQIIEDGDEIDIDFKKFCPINSGKLCKFGIDLPMIYGNALKMPLMDGKEIDYREGISKAANLLNKWYNSSKGKEGVVLCCGDATNEELLAIKDFSSYFGMKCASGLGNILKVIGNSPFVHDIKDFDIIEGFDKIALVNLDPYYQYPLVARKLQNAKAKGKRITSIGPEGSHIERLADEVILCSPAEVNECFKEYISGNSDDSTLYITSMGLYTDPALLAEINNACAKTRSRAFFLKDYANTEASLVLGFNNYGYGIEEIIDHIESGMINSMVLIESPLFDTYLDSQRFRNACEMLDTLIVIQSGMPKDLPKNALLLPLPAFYKRKGTLVNACGRLIDLDGSDAGIIDIFNDMKEALKHKDRLDFEAYNSKVFNVYKKWISSFREYGVVEVPKPLYSKKGPLHYYVVNPHLIRGMSHQLPKRTSEGLYQTVSEKERYVIKKKIAEGVVLAYQRDEKYTKLISAY